MSDVRHVLSLSGGKDSSALAIYMRDRVPNMEYVFCDTHKELQETYDYLDRLQVYLGKPIVRLSDERGFDHWLEVFHGYLPSSRMRWCTKLLKIKPFEQYVGDDPVRMYIGIRADEDRTAYISTKDNITPAYPFKEDGIDEAGVHRILEESGMGLPAYYQWRTRSGCYFCFFQRRKEWVELMRRHPTLFELAKAYEKSDQERDLRFTWNERESLEELSRPERVAQIDADHEKRMKAERAHRPNRPLIEVLADVYDDENDDQPCLMCQV